tara:strand:- start:19717 stop:20028 length:312 start_codon:yes stop_codon:yes gene_type:complete
VFRIVKVISPGCIEEIYLKNYDITCLKVRTVDVEHAIRKLLLTPLSPNGNWCDFVNFHVEVTEDVVDDAPADKTIHFSTTIGSQKIVLEYHSPSAKNRSLLLR